MTDAHAGRVLRRIGGRRGLRLRRYRLGVPDGGLLHLNSRLNFRLVISAFRFLGRDLIFVSMKLAAAHCPGLTTGAAFAYQICAGESGLVVIFSPPRTLRRT